MPPLTFSRKFHKTDGNNYDCRENRSEQKSASETVLRQCIIIWHISRWDEITFKMYIEMRLHQKWTGKRLSFLKYQNLINKGH